MYISTLQSLRSASSRLAPGAVVQVLVAVAMFVLAVRLLGSATEALAPVFRHQLTPVLDGETGALGASWLATYAVANGSVIAALSLSLFTAGVVSPSQLFVMVVGSRLGAAAIVVFVGVLDFHNEELESLREATSLGVLTFLLTHSIYLPAMALGIVAVPHVAGLGGLALDPDVDATTPGLVSPVTDAVVGLVGPVAALVVALALILVSLRRFDAVLDGLDKQRLRQRYVTRLNDRWLSFGLGLVVTGLTTSIALSLGVLVPLYNRGHVTRNEIMPFVLGANVGTLVDTLVVAVALDTPTGVRTVVVLLTLGVVLSVLVLAVYPTYRTVLNLIQARLLARPGYFAGFLVSLVVVPMALLVY